MTKKLISVIAIVAAIAVLAGALYFLSKPVETDDDFSSSLTEVIYVLGEAQPEPVKSVEVKNQSGSFTVEVRDPEASSSDMEYILKGYEDFPTSKSLLAPVVDNSKKLIGKSLVSEGAAEFATYGLDRPSVTLDISLANGGKATLLVGDAAPGGEGYYVTAKSDNVYLANASYIDAFFKQPMEFMDLTLTEGSAEEDYFNDVTLGGTVREEPIVVKKLTEAKENSFSSHTITSPIEADLDTDKGATALMSAFGLAAQSAVDEVNDGNLARHGLSEPYSTISVSSDTVPAFTLSASEPDADGMVNIMLSTSPLIYSISRDSLPWLEVQVHDLMSKMAILPHIDSISRVTVATPTESWSFVCQGEDDDFTCTYNGADIPVDHFRKFYQSLIAASFDSVPDEPLPGDAAPVLTYTYEYRESGRQPDVVKFYTGPARKYYITLNDGTAFFTLSTYVDKVLADIPLIIRGEAVSSYL